ncbi:serine/threonine protein kinase [Gracilaria domingensis]|nr:serine/threonine protein kinase [Gracilaria domingensis]
MEIVKTSFMYEVKDGKPVFSHTSILHSYKDDLYVAHLPRRVYEREYKDFDFEALDGILVNPGHVYPEYDKTMFSIVSGSLGKEVFEKEPFLLSYGCEPNIDDTMVWKEMYEEALVCEKLRTNPHPNIARYMGCRVVNGYIVSLCFEKYTETLRDRLSSGRKRLDKDGCLQGIEHALDHLHSLGLCHNDISPCNIMFKEDDTPVLIDFDSCRPIGSSLGGKRGTPGFSMEDVSVSSVQNDHFGLKKIGEYLEDECRALN